MTAITRVDNNQNAAEAARQFGMIFENTDYSEIDKRLRALALGLSVNDDGESSVKPECELQSDEQDQIQRRYKRQPRLSGHAGIQMGILPRATALESSTSLQTGASSMSAEPHYGIWRPSPFHMTIPVAVPPPFR